MSLVMLAAGRLGAMGAQPPERVTEEALGRAGAGDTSEGTQNATACVAHLAFGAVGGATYALLHRRRGLPALGILPPAERDRPGRRRTMIAAHLVYGTVLGAVEDRRGARPTPAAALRMDGRPAV